MTTGDATLTVNWIIPRSNGSIITGYDVWYRPCTETNGDMTVLTCASNPTWGEWVKESISGETVTTLAVTSGLVNGTAYQVRVRATTADEESPWSPPAIGMPRGAPAEPMMTLASGNARLIVTWPRPNARGSTITSFQLRYCDNQDLTKDCSTSDYADWTTRTGIGSTATSYTISGLTNGNSHLVEMRTISRSHGESVWTGQATGTPGGPNPPSTPRVTAGNARITVTWTAPAINASPIVEYEVDYCNDTDEDCSALGAGWATNTAVSHATLTDLEVVLSSLTNGDTYKVRVRARNGQGWGAWSSMATARPTSA